MSKIERSDMMPKIEERVLKEPDNSVIQPIIGDMFNAWSPQYNIDSEIKSLERHIKRVKDRNWSDNEANAIIFHLLRRQFPKRFEEAEKYVQRKRMKEYQDRIKKLKK